MLTHDHAARKEQMEARLQRATEERKRWEAEAELQRRNLGYVPENVKDALRKARVAERVHLHALGIFGYR